MSIGFEGFLPLHQSPRTADARHIASHYSDRPGSSVNLNGREENDEIGEMGGAVDPEVPGNLGED